MNEQMEFPNTFDEFADYYGFKDSKEIYTNGSMLIPIFRVKQWLEHDNKLRKIETDTAYECGKHAEKYDIFVEVLDKIKTEIETDLSHFCFDDWGNETTEWKEVKDIIDKYKESEG